MPLPLRKTLLQLLLPISLFENNNSIGLLFNFNDIYIKQYCFVEVSKEIIHQNFINYKKYKMNFHPICLTIVIFIY